MTTTPMPIDRRCSLLADRIAQALYDDGDYADIVSEEDARFSPSLFRVEVTDADTTFRVVVNPPEPFTPDELEVLAQALRIAAAHDDVDPTRQHLVKGYDDLHDKAQAILTAVGR
jgi:hypothetical protein